jgi:uncharacterized membrane protein YkvA (DUF1232 family)
MQARSLGISDDCGDPTERLYVIETAAYHNRGTSKRVDRMQIERIRTQIEEGKIIEQQSGVLRRAVGNLAKLNGVRVTELQVKKIIGFVTEYIEHAPALMMIIEETAAMSGAQPDVQPILDVTENYFLAPDDIIPDHFGLVGLLDDAYLTHTLMEAISDKYRLQTGNSLLPIDSHETNTFIRRLIGEPFVRILDEHVATTLDGLSEKQDINQILVVLARMNLPSVPQPSLGNTRVTEIIGIRI